MSIIPGRTFTIDDCITEFTDTMNREGRTYCPVVKKLKQMKAEGGTIADFERWIFAQPFAVEYIVDVIRTAGTHHPPDIAANCQTAYAWQLTQFPWERVRQPLELLLHGDVVQGIAPPAMHILLGIIREHHPNPKRFCAHPHVLSKTPFYVDMTDWRCREDDDEFQAARLLGRRNWDWDMNPPERVWEQLTTGEPTPAI